VSTAIIRPTSAGDLTQLSVYGVTYNWDAVDDVSPDNAGTFVVEGTGYLRTDLYTLSDLSLSGRINWIKIWMCTYMLSGWGKTAIKTEGGTFFGSVVGTGLWQYWSTQYTTNPQVGGAWTWAQINALQGGVALVGVGSKGSYVSCTQVYVEIDYDPMRVFMLGEL
jgi:hypothetical protein